MLQQPATSAPRKLSNNPLLRKISSLVPPQHLLSLSSYEKQERKHRKISAALVEDRQCKVALPVLAASTAICAQDNDPLRKLSTPLVETSGITGRQQFLFDDGFAVLPPMKPKSLSVREKLHLAFFGNSNSKSPSSHNDSTTQLDVERFQLQLSSNNTLVTASSSETSNGSLGIGLTTTNNAERLHKLSNITLTTLSEQSNSSSSSASITHTDGLVNLNNNNNNNDDFKISSTLTTPRASEPTTTTLDDNRKTESSDSLKTFSAEKPFDCDEKFSNNNIIKSATSEVSNVSSTVSCESNSSSTKSSASTPRLRKTGLFVPSTPEEGRRTISGSTTQKSLHFLGLTTLSRQSSDSTVDSIIDTVKTNKDTTVVLTNNKDDALSSSSCLNKPLVIEGTNNCNNSVLTQIKSLKSVEVTTPLHQQSIGQESTSLRQTTRPSSSMYNLSGYSVLSSSKKNNNSLLSNNNDNNNNNNNDYKNNENECYSCDGSEDEKLNRMLEEVEKFNVYTSCSLKSESVSVSSQLEHRRAASLKLTYGVNDGQKKRENLFDVFFVDLKEFDASPESYI